MIISKRLFLILCLVVGLAFSSQVLAQKNYKPKVDNFIFLFDASGSMSQEYMGSVENKAILGQAAIAAINQTLCQHDFQAGLYTVASDFKAYQEMGPYHRTTYGQAIDQLPTDMDFFGNPTPLAEGMMHLDNILAEVSGRTAIILVSDGGENRRGDPVAVAEELYDAYDICFHVISYAQDEQEKAILNGIAGINDCSVMVDGQELQDQKSLNHFVQEVFYTLLADSDNDGVHDQYDQCPDTPHGVEVDETGCPVDSDGDGVADYLDKCPDTPQNMEVDAHGCPIQVSMSLTVHFDFNKSEIKQEFQSDLQNAANFLQKHPRANLRIEGHTDSVGSEEYNQKLSRERAQQVKTYLIEQFDLPEERITCVGYGESQPIADNQTQQGRRENRRAVLKIIDAYKMK